MLFGHQWGLLGRSKRIAGGQKGIPEDIMDSTRRSGGGRKGRGARKAVKEEGGGGLSAVAGR